LPKKALPQLPYINIHKHGQSLSEGELAISSIFSKDIPELVGKWNGPLSIGLHPWHVVAKNSEKQLSFIEKAASNESVIAIGEIGLDHLASASMELQKSVFIKQLQIAANSNKPVIVHCVKAHSEIISIVKREQFNCKVIFHGFNQNEQIAEQLLKNGFYLSFGHALMNEKSNACKVFSKIPENRFVLETDEADINIIKIYKRAAALRNTEVDIIKKSVFDNFAHCFNYKI
jgi:TatD DNase family protein